MARSGLGSRAWIGLSPNRERADPISAGRAPPGRAGLGGPPPPGFSAGFGARALHRPPLARRARHVAPDAPGHAVASSRAVQTALGFRRQSSLRPGDRASPPPAGPRRSARGAPTGSG